MSSASVDSFTYAVPASFIVLFLSASLFQWEYQLAAFPLLLYLGFPVVIYLLSSLFTFLAHYSSCPTLRIGDVFLYTLPSMGLTWISLFVSYFTWPRIPIASAIAPLFLGQSTDVVRTPDKKECCGPQLTLQALEKKEPMVKGLAYGFYLFFSTLLGLLISIGFASAC